jgi:hypothetical protein
MKPKYMCAAMVVITGLSLFVAERAAAHCDTLDGPVVKDARLALAKKDPAPVLKWIKKEDEPALRAAFAKAISVRSKGADAQDIADTYFFETLVRLHRASEGEPFTGLKPAGAQEPMIVEADRALDAGSIDSLVGHLATEVETSIRQRFSDASSKRKHKDESVEAGRDYVAAYVSFLHYLEHLAAAIGGEEGGHDR